MFQTKVVINPTTHILYSIPFFSAKRCVWPMVCKNMVQPDRQQVPLACRITEGYIKGHNQNISTATMVTRTRQNIALNAYCLS
jgi:hypothetical protein